MILTGETEEHGAEPVLVSLFPTQILYGLTCNRTRAFVFLGRHLIT